MTATWGVDFTEAVAQRGAASIPLSHLSIELGHLYFDEFAAGLNHLSPYFERIAPWVDAARRACANTLQPGRARVSTCFLIDDYYRQFSSPAEVLPQLIKAAEAQGLVIDYIARESGCVDADGVPLAELVLDRLVPDPQPGTTGTRPPTTVTGWLCNGQRSPHAGSDQAMSLGRQWRPASENGAVNHSIFVDVELWDEHASARRWSCPFLAAVWQLLRLGLLRHHGEAVAQPVQVDEYPDDWNRLPAVIRVNPTAYPFSAYRTFSVLGSRFLSIEHAVRTILQQVTIELAVSDQVHARSAAEKATVPAEVWKRIEYVFIADQEAPAASRRTMALNVT